MLDLLALDHALADTHLALAAHALARPADAPPSPRRAVSTLELARSLDVLASDPLGAAARAWVVHFTVLRVTNDDLDAIREAGAEPVEDPDGRPPRELARALLEQGKAPLDAMRALASVGHGVLDATLRWLERVREAERRAGITRLDARPEAEALLAGLDLIDRAPRAPLEVIDLARSGARGEGWPAHLTARTVTELLGRAWLDGVRLPRVRLPAPLGVSSFARAFDAVGRALALVDWDRTRPFVLSRAPRDLLGARRGALLAALVLDPVFHRRRLGLTASAARDEVRAVARASVAWGRLAALRVLLPDALGEARRAQAFQELTERVFGCPWPAHLAAVLPRVVPDASEDLVALLRAERDRQTLSDRFDEDWFDNPRALEALRHEHHLSALDRDEAPEGVVAVDRSLRRLRELLDG